MRILQKMSENIKKGIRNWLNIQPVQPYALQIQEVMDYELSAIRNRIWYRGDSNEIEQMYQQNPEYADKNKFWASKSSPGMEMRKIHSGLPSLIVRTLTNVVLSDMNEMEFEKDAHAVRWKEISRNYKFQKLIEKGCRDALVVGDGAFKITIDTEADANPLLEWYPGERVEYVYSHGVLKEIIFKTPYSVNMRQYVLHERYGYGYVRYALYLDEKEVPLDTIDVTSGMEDVAFDPHLMMAEKLQIFDNTKYENRGGSVYDGKQDSFDAFDEVWSQWMDAIRKGRATRYIPENLIPRNPNGGELLKPNPFDNSFIKIDSDMSEKSQNVITTEQPVIPHESYISSYTTALDLCLQGLISPSTLGIDVKKLDNAEAQREKEKTTLYTRGAIIEALQEAIPSLVNKIINTSNVMNNKDYEEVKADLPFGEYANPSFESQVETISKAKNGGIMSLEASVDELYGDSRDETWKKEEVERLKAEQGIAEVAEPAVNTEADSFRIRMEGQDDSRNREPGIPGGQTGVQPAAADGQ